MSTQAKGARGHEKRTHNIQSFRCVTCGADACYGLSWPLVEREQWFCPAHKPADFYGARDGQKAA
jgi:hypothetical protein